MSVESGRRTPKTTSQALSSPSVASTAVCVLDTDLVPVEEAVLEYFLDGIFVNRGEDIDDIDCELNVRVREHTNGQTQP